MSKARPSPIDIVGITLGTIVLIVVIASVALIAHGHGSVNQWRGLDMRRWWAPERFQPFQNRRLREEKDEQVSGNFATIEIRNIAGEIDIHGGTGDCINVHSVKSAMFPAAMENLTVGIEKRGDRLLVEERHEIGFLMSAGVVSLNITLPRSIRTIEAHSVSGSITVHDVPIGISQNLNTISGPVSTVNTGNLDISSTSGSVQFTFGGDRLNAHTVSGSIEGQIESLGQGGTATLRSVSGSVDIEAYDGLNAFVSLSSMSGAVSCGFPLTVAVQRRNSLEGKIGEGSSRVDVATTSGTIAIRKM